MLKRGSKSLGLEVVFALPIYQPARSHLGKFPGAAVLGDRQRGRAVA